MNRKPFNSIANTIRSSLGQKTIYILYYVLLSLLILLCNASMSVYYDLDSLSVFSQVLHYGRMLILMLLLMHSTFFVGEHTVMEFIVYGFTGILLLLVYMNVPDKTLIMSLCVIYSAKGIDIKKIANTYLLTYTAMTVMIIALFKLGILSELVMPRTSTMFKHSLGFDHPNSLGRVLFVIQSAFVIRYKHNIHHNIWFYLLSAALCVFSYYVPNCRAAVVCIMLNIFLVLLMGTSIFKTHFVQNIIIAVPLLSAVFSIGCTVLFGTGFTKIFGAINKISTGRVYLMNSIFQKIGDAGLLGQNALQLGIPIDNCYNMFFLCFGYFALIIFLAGYFLAMKNAIRHDRFDLLVCLISFAVFGIFEMHTYYIIYNLALLSISASLTGEHSRILSNT